MSEAMRPSGHAQSRDPRLDRLAEMLVDRCTRVKGGDLVTVVGPPASLPAVEAVFEATLRRGGHPSFHVKPESLQGIMLSTGSMEQVRHVCPFEEHRLRTCDVLIVIQCPSNTRHLAGIDPGRVAAQQGARKGLMSMSLDRLASGSVRYVATEIPSEGGAADAEMDPVEYADWVYRAGFLHLPDPLGAWKRLEAQHEQMVTHLRGTEFIRFTAPASGAGEGTSEAHAGTDLTVNVTGREWIGCAGKTNFPDGEVYTGPVSVDGVLSVPRRVMYKGQGIRGIRLRFRDGRVVEASAKENEAYLHRLLDQDAGASTAGEIAMGTNFGLARFVNNAFFDEKIGGTFHVGVGAGYPESGNTNQSGLHWDLVVDLRAGGRIEADGKMIQENGRFVCPGWPGV